MKSFILQLFIIVIVFNLVSMVRESSMLSSWDNDTAPNFELTALNNQKTYLFDGQNNNSKKTVLYFFAPWCSICKMSISNLQKLHENSDEINVVAVALDFVNPLQVKDFAQNLHLSLPIVYGNEEVKKAYQVSAYPSYYVVANNQIQHRSMGYSTELGLFLRSR
ncbi:TlpA family protein disulfide reductase [Thalassotalea sp. ND16A]|uniref:TlpA family protein disulfide reductase n=1 Tax=Thalassotalea sp. ND16A TaxID=1535422 RepID=UPI00051A03BC|nr:redoxin domain-containing protein [Thalassotalea sp. ND16A]KGJ98359.1 hypothetical protein ND16A_0668 [Thalassotalea sp. ND16A]